MRLLISGSVWSFAFQASSKTALLVTTFISARLLGVHGFGLLASLQGVAIVAASILDFGTSMFVQRELAAGRLALESWRIAVRLRLLLCPAALGLALASIWIAPDGQGIALASLIVASFAMNVSALTNGALQGQLRFRSSAVTQGAGRVAFLIVLLGEWVSNFASLGSVAAAFACGEIVIAVLQGKLVRGTVRRTLQPAGGQRVPVAGSLPYWLNSVFNLLYNRADAAIVAIFAGATQAGLYAPASSIQNALMIIPGMATAALPSVGAHAFTSHGLRTLRPMVRITLITAVLLGTFAAIAATLVAPVVLRLAAGGAFNGAVIPTQILVWSLPFYGAELALLAYLTAAGRPAATTWGYGTALVSALVGLATLSPRFGATGAAIGSLAREPVTLLVLTVLALRVHEPSTTSIQKSPMLPAAEIDK